MSITHVDIESWEEGGCMRYLVWLYTSEGPFMRDVRPGETVGGVAAHYKATRKVDNKCAPFFAV